MNPTDDSFRTDAEPGPGAVAAHCFRLAEQIGGGPVRDALLAMGRDYAGRAHDAARTSAFHFELAQSQRPAHGLRALHLLAELLEPLPQATRRAPPPSAAPAVPRPGRVAAPTALAPAAPPPRRSRLYRTHAVSAIRG
jgi:hypothetical protein